eukprot:gene25157-biopygen8997
MGDSDPSGERIKLCGSPLCKFSQDDALYNTMLSTKVAADARAAMSKRDRAATVPLPADLDADMPKMRPISPHPCAGRVRSPRSARRTLREHRDRGRSSRRATNESVQPLPHLCPYRLPSFFCVAWRPPPSPERRRPEGRFCSAVCLVRHHSALKRKGKSSGDRLAVL